MRFERAGGPGPTRPGGLDVTWRASVLCQGQSCGEVLRLDAPISFWGGIDHHSGKVTLAGHPQLGACVTGKILVLPKLIGSSSSSAILLELLYNGRAPDALILGHSDAILPVGVVVAAQMDWPTIPVLALLDPPFKTGERLSLDPDGKIERI